MEPCHVLAAGQSWRLRSHDFEGEPRLVIGAILAFESSERVVCVSLIDAAPIAPAPDGSQRTITFLPLSEAAFRDSVTEVDGTGEPAEGFAAEFEIWRADPRGLSVFTVPFDGSLDRLIARQMEAIVSDRQPPSG